MKSAGPDGGAGDPCAVKGNQPQSPQTRPCLAGVGPLAPGQSRCGPQAPCANATLAAAGVNAQEQIAMAQGLISAGKIGGGSSTFSNLVFEFFGGMFGYYEAVHTGGPNDIKNQPGPGYHNQTGVDAGEYQLWDYVPVRSRILPICCWASPDLDRSPKLQWNARDRIRHPLRQHSDPGGTGYES